MYKLLVLNTDDKECAYGGICPFMRNMHPYLSKSFIVDYLVLPERWKRLPGPVRFYYCIYLLFHLSKLSKFDFILSHAVEGSYFASFTKTPYAHIFHGNTNPVEFSRFFYGSWFVGVYNKMYDRIKKTASLLYTVGPTDNDRIKKLYNPLNQNVAPLPISERKGFVFAGRLEIVKRVDLLIEIYSQLPKPIQEQNPFYIIGYGTLESSLRRLVSEKGLEDRVIFVGKVENSLMMKTVADKKIMLMASITEGFPTAIAEAFSVGLPVVTTAVGDISSIVKDGVNGRLLQADFDINDYINSINSVLDDYTHFSDEAFETSSVFNSEIITKGVVKDIDSILES